MQFTHLNERGDARMVDVTAKQPTVRSATAEAMVACSPDVVRALRDGTVPKGDVLAVARVAGIAAAKKVPDLLPLAHVIGVHGVALELTIVDEGVQLRADVKYRGPDRGRDGGANSGDRCRPRDCGHGQRRGSQRRNPSCAGHG
jgi:cyclic pyranopterin phosphate synthase